MSGRDIGQILRSIDSKITYRDSKKYPGTINVYYDKCRVGIIVQNANFHEFQYHSKPPVRKFATISPIFDSLQDLKNYLEGV